MDNRICPLGTIVTEDGAHRYTRSGHIWFGTGELVGATGGTVEVYESSSTEAVRVLADGASLSTPGPLAWLAFTCPPVRGEKPQSAFVTLGAAGMAELHARIGAWLSLHGYSPR